MVFSRGNRPRIKDGTNVINFDDKQSKWTHWVSLFISEFISLMFLGFNIVLKKDWRKSKTSITHNIFWIQHAGSINCGFYCIALIEYMIVRKTLLHYTNLFSRNGYNKNEKIKYQNFNNKYGKRKHKPWL